MASSPTPYPHALTTIFNPPRGCFDGVEHSSRSCDLVETSDGTGCVLTVSKTCYPPSALTSQTVFHDGIVPFANRYEYYPGVLPSGYTSVEGRQDGVDIDSITGCPTGFDLGPFKIWCTPTLTSETSTFVGILPFLVVSWASPQLSLFTPASAPVLAASAIQEYESTALASSTSATPRSAKPGTTPTQTQQPSSGTQPHQITHSPTAPGGISTGAKAGIAVGAAMGVLAVVILGYVLLRRRKKGAETSKTHSPHRTPSTRPYLDGKTELHAHERRAHELPGEREPQELGPSNNPPPIPIASKPRSRGGNEMHELG